jgi:predicted membrane GTPase involved in stress response
MVVGRANDDKNVSINVVRAKKMTNMRAFGSDDTVLCAPASAKRPWPKNYPQRRA